MTRARQFIEDHQAEPLSLGRIAQVANISRHYFCKMFKKATGINFTDYLSRVRVEKSKALLLNPNSRISEAAFACGFQSMTNFNREFKRIVGRLPRNFAKRFRSCDARIGLSSGERPSSSARRDSCVTHRRRRWAIPVRFDSVGMLDAQGVVESLVGVGCKSGFRQTSQLLRESSKCGAGR